MRPATDDDIENMVQAITPDMEKGHFESAHPDKFRDFLKGCIKGKSGEPTHEVDTSVHVIEVEGRFGGFAIVRDYLRPKADPLFPENAKELWILSIDKAMRGKRLGKTLTMELMQQYSQTCLYAICKPASKDMAGILRSLGFAELGKVPFSPDTILYLDRSDSLPQVQERLRARQSPGKGRRLADGASRPGN